MEDEIDLQKYFLLLKKNWLWIVGASLATALSVFLFSRYFLDPTYEARVLVVVIQPNYSLTLDPKFETDNKTDLNFYRPVAQLAKTDDLMMALRDAWAAQGGSPPYSISELKGMTEVETGSTINAVDLVVTSKNAETSATLVNIWGQLFVQQANDVFSQSLEGVDSLNSELEKIVEARASAQQAFIQFEEESMLGAFEASLLTKETIYGQVIAEQEKVTQTLNDLGILGDQIAVLPANQPVSSDIELTALLLQIRAYNLDTTLMQVQLVAQPPETPRTARELTAHLDQLSIVLTQKIEDYVLQVSRLESEIMALQGNIKELETSREKLQQDYQVASEAYLTLSRKLEEIQIANEVSSGTVKLASGASVPRRPSGPNIMLYTLIGGFLGFTGSIFLILAGDFWKSLSETEAELRTVKKPVKA